MLTSALLHRSTKHAFSESEHVHFEITFNILN